MPRMYRRPAFCLSGTFQSGAQVEVDLHQRLTMGVLIAAMRAVPPKSPDLLQEARILQTQIGTLRVLLDLQLSQVRALDRRFAPSTPAGMAAHRLLALKQDRC
jgi:hypothetical protein